MKMQIKNSRRIIAGITLLVVLLFVTAFKAKEQLDQTAVAQTQVAPSKIDIHIVVMIDKVEALKQFIVGWQRAWE